MTPTSLLPDDRRILAALKETDPCDSVGLFKRTGILGVGPSLDRLYVAGLVSYIVPRPVKWVRTAEGTAALNEGTVIA